MPAQESMRLGVVFPQTEIGADPAAVRDYAQAAENLGYHHLLVYDHVLGANAAGRTGWQGPYQHTDMFHEPMVLFGYLAGITHSIELVTGIIILPQRQTVLLAKQATQVDLLSGGRLRLGIGTGWNTVEYEALNENFHDRGQRSEEQVEVMRRLWTQDLVTYEGRWHRITDAGLNPLPVQRPIPIWFGGMADQVLKRTAHFGDGWFPQFQPGKKAKLMLDTLHQYTREAGRSPSDIGIEGHISISQDRPEKWSELLGKWKDLGATHMSVNTMGAGMESPMDHINAIRRFKEVSDT